MTFTYKQREDLPSSFKENHTNPEIPAAVIYLNQFVGDEYESVSDFEIEVLKKFNEFLITNKIYNRSDLPSGLKFKSVPNDNLKKTYYIYMEKRSPLEEKLIFGHLK